LCVTGLVGDYLAELDALPAMSGRRLFVFLGGTIGNFTAAEAVRFLRGVRGCMCPDDRLLLGADRVKDPTVLHRAYNDAAGITAEFNLNLLRVLNRELRADFDPGAFAHEALYNPQAEQIEMYLVASRSQTVSVGALGRAFRFEAGERMLTEISRKFTPDSLRGLFGAAGFTIERHYQPDNGYFSLVLAAP
ncbi:MAG: L-histidine N(alpha)-methyltransferase, partial [Gammaproteobacteria bacterium]